MPPSPDSRLLRKTSRSQAVESPRFWFRVNFCGLVEVLSLHPTSQREGNVTNRNITKALRSQEFLGGLARKQFGVRY